ncbi:MAG: GGDEF domain-containing protein [Campylobacterota bacterium]
MENDKILNIISNETKDAINQMPLVTPSIFSSIFSKFATNHNVEIEDEETLSLNILKDQCSTLTALQNEASKSAQYLSDSTEKAINAIQDKDKSKLTEVLQETKDLRAEIEKLKESVYKDELTNTYNRKWLNDNYLKEGTENLEGSGVLSIVDLNYFKIVNDMHGHVIGDKVLIFIANELRKSGYDIIRYGGDEFIIMFPEHINEERALKILNNTREVIITKKLKAHNTTFRTSFSIGAHKYISGDSLVETIEAADKNMYEDKENIKKRVPGIEI